LPIPKSQFLPGFFANGADLDLITSASSFCPSAVLQKLTLVW
jgi:hypothetical protein